MQREQIVFVGTSDLSGHFRGKSFPAADLPARLERGVGLAPTNLFLGAFGGIQYSPFGTVGEVYLLPDAATRVLVPFEGSATEYFLLGDLVTDAGSPWEFCPRQLLRGALDRLERLASWRLLATFEQEFVYSGVLGQPAQPYELDAYRRQGLFGEVLLAALRQAGVLPDGFLSEFGPRQFEVTVAPAIGLRAADQAVITRELTQAVAHRFGHRVCFAPMPEFGGTSSGTHIHFSFLDVDDRPAAFDPTGALQLSALASRFVAGILAHLPAICAVTAPSVASYYRLRPNKFAPLQSDLGLLDRGAAVRICPATGKDPAQRARSFNLEFRVADATASPYLALAMMVHAGCDGIEAGNEAGAHVPQALPADLGAALDALQSSAPAAGWMGPLHAPYIAFKRAEIEGLREFNEHETCRRYAEVY
jgi:glutamine synthetase